MKVSEPAPPRDDATPDPGASRVLPLALGTIVLSLILLVVIPILVEAQLARLHTDRLETIDLAARESNELAFALAREMVLSSGGTAGDTLTLRDLAQMRAREAEALRRLEELDDQLPNPVRHRVADLRRLAYTRLGALGSPTVGGPDPSTTSATLQWSFVAELAALGAVRQSLDTARTEIMGQVVRAERYGLAATIGLAVLALVSTVWVVWLGHRVRRYADEAKRGHRAALQANEARTRLMRGFSHDMKNPLGVVTLSAELLRMGAHGQLSAEQTQVVERMERSAQQGLDLLGDILELSRAEAGQLTLEVQEIDPSKILHEIGSQHAAKAEAAGLSLRIQIPDAVPSVFADPSRVRQILDNLVGNAINYTPGGGAITLSATRRRSGPDGRAGDWGTFSVSDTGRGIPSEEMNRIFEEFARFPGSDGRHGGTGIGLAISRQLARLMNGEITLESEVGAGSTFTLWLPISPAPDAL